MGYDRRKDYWLKADKLTNAPLVLECYLSQHGLVQSWGQLFFIRGALIYVYQAKQETIAFEVDYVCSVVHVVPATARVAFRHLCLLVVYCRDGRLCRVVEPKMLVLVLKAVCWESDCRLHKDIPSLQPVNISWLVELVVDWDIRFETLRAVWLTDRPLRMVDSEFESGQ